jgi:hypothetical protein
MDDLPDAFEAAIHGRLGSEARAADDALKLFREQSGFGRARLRMEERMEKLKQGSLPDFRSKARSDLVLKLFDTRACTFLPFLKAGGPLVEGYEALLVFFKSVAWEEFTGYQREILLARGRFLAGVEEELNKHEQEWLTKARERIAPQPETVSVTGLADKRVPTDRRKAVDDYINEVFHRTKKMITRTDIWKSAGYKTRTEFEKWERRDPKKQNMTANVRLTRILAEKPHLT